LGAISKIRGVKRGLTSLGRAKGGGDVVPRRPGPIAVKSRLRVKDRKEDPTNTDLRGEG